MVKVFIADDNPLIRQSLIQTIQWESLQCQVVCEANDGVEALELARTNPPDILITDIKMPGIDGLELTEQIKSLYPWVMVIIITGYDDFAYAQRAVKLGAFDLILKPIDNDEMQRTVINAVKELYRERAEEKRNSDILHDRNRMRHLLDASKSDLVKSFFMDMLQGSLTDKHETEQKAHALGLEFKQHAVVIIKPEILSKGNSVSCRDRLNDFCKASESILSRIVLPEKMRAFMVWYNDSLTIFILLDDSSPNKLNIQMTERCTEIARLLDHEFSRQYAIGISNVHRGVHEVLQSYQEAQTAIDSHFFADSASVIHFGSLQSKSILNEYPILKKISNIDGYIRSGDRNIENLLDDIFSEIMKNETKNAAYVRSLLIDMCTISRRILFDKNIVPTDAVLHNKTPYNDIYACGTMSAAFEYVREFILSIFEEVNSTPKKSLNTSIKIIIDYLNRNYDKKILLQELAELVSLSPTHLSRLIKKETGKSFVDLFNSIKINVAVKLLGETNLKAYEVAEKVGFENYAYFFQIFKKVTGSSPKDFFK